MIGLIVDMLSIDDFKGKSENIEIAKGKYKMPQTFREGWRQYKRGKVWQLKR